MIFNWCQYFCCSLSWLNAGTSSQHTVLKRIKFLLRGAHVLQIFQLQRHSTVLWVLLLGKSTDGGICSVLLRLLQAVRLKEHFCAACFGHERLHQIQLFYSFMCVSFQSVESLVSHFSFKKCSFPVLFIDEYFFILTFISNCMALYSFLHILVKD